MTDLGPHAYDAYEQQLLTRFAAGTQRDAQRAVAMSPPMQITRSLLLDMVPQGMLSKSEALRLHGMTPKRQHHRAAGKPSYRQRQSRHRH